MGTVKHTMILLYLLRNTIILTQVIIFLRQGQLVIEAEKAAAYPASSVCFSFFINIYNFILEIFRIALATSK